MSLYERRTFFPSLKCRHVLSIELMRSLIIAARTELCSRMKVLHSVCTSDSEGETAVRLVRLSVRHPVMFLCLCARHKHTHTHTHTHTICGLQWKQPTKGHLLETNKRQMLTWKRKVVRDGDDGGGGRPTEILLVPIWTKGTSILKEYFIPKIWMCMSATRMTLNSRRKANLSGSMVNGESQNKGVFMNWCRSSITIIKTIRSPTHIHSCCIIQASFIRSSSHSCRWVWIACWAGAHWWTLSRLSFRSKIIENAIISFG